MVDILSGLNGANVIVKQREKIEHAYATTQNRLWVVLIVKELQSSMHRVIRMTVMVLVQVDLHLSSVLIVSQLAKIWPMMARNNVIQNVSQVFNAKMD